MPVRGVLTPSRLPSFRCKELAGPHGSVGLFERSGLHVFWSAASPKGGRHVGAGWTSSFPLALDTSVQADAVSVLMATTYQPIEYGGPAAQVPDGCFGFLWR
jgi:hypothetical protein